MVRLLHLRHGGCHRLRTALLPASVAARSHARVVRDVWRRLRRPAQGAYIGTQPAVFSELFPTATRYSGTSLSNTLGTILGGAPAPFIAAWLYDAFGSSNAVGVYITIMALVWWLAVLGLKETQPSRSQ